MEEFIPSEYEEQATFVEFLELKGIKFSAVPNSTYTTSWQAKRDNYVLGLRKGMPDLIILIKKEQSKIGIPCLVFVEMKRLKRSKTSPEQKEWIEEFNKIANIEAKVCFGASEAINYISEFII